jgi:hypothetical protein
MRSFVDVEGTDTSKKSGVDDCDSAQAGEMAIGVRIPTKLATNSRKEARIGIYEDLIRLYHAWPESVNGPTPASPRIPGDGTRNLDIPQLSCTLRTRINVSFKPS